MNRLLEFRMWGSVPHCDAVNSLTADLLVQKVLFAIRNVPKTAGRIAEEIHADKRTVEDVLTALQGYHLAVKTRSDSRWETSVAIFLREDIRVARELGRKYGEIESAILREAIPSIRGIFEKCSVAVRYAWDCMSSIVVGGLIADFCVLDRVRFRAGNRSKSLLPTIRPDGTRWEFTGFELDNGKVYPDLRWEFYQNASYDSAGGIARWGCLGERRGQPSQPEVVLFENSARAIVKELSGKSLAIEELSARTGLPRSVVEEKIRELSDFDPPAVLEEPGLFSLDLPMLSEDDLASLLAEGDDVAQAIHDRTILPSLAEREQRSKELGLKTILPGDTLARDFALQTLIEEGILAQPSLACLPWNAGVWGWHGHLAMWDEVA